MNAYLEVIYRSGRALGAYLYLPRQRREKSVRSAKAPVGMVVDFDRNGKPIGIELTAPGLVTLPALNEVLRELGLPSLSAADVEPLRAA